MLSGFDNTSGCLQPCCCNGRGEVEVRSWRDAATAATPGSSADLTPATDIPEVPPRTMRLPSRHALPHTSAHPPQNANALLANALLENQLGITGTATGKTKPQPHCAISYSLFHAPFEHRQERPGLALASTTSSL